LQNKSYEVASSRPVSSHRHPHSESKESGKSRQSDLLFGHEKIIPQRDTKGKKSLYTI
jgi:hypothetical protein